MAYLAYVVINVPEFSTLYSMLMNTRLRLRHHPPCLRCVPSVVNLTNTVVSVCFVYFDMLHRFNIQNINL